MKFSPFTLLCFSSQKKPISPWVFSELFNNVGLASRYCSLLFGYDDKCWENNNKEAVCQRGNKRTTNLICTVGEDSNCSASIAVKIWCMQEIKLFCSKHMKGGKKGLGCKNSSNKLDNCGPIYIHVQVQTELRHHLWKMSLGQGT